MSVLAGLCVALALALPPWLMHSLAWRTKRLRRFEAAILLVGPGYAFLMISAAFGSYQWVAGLPIIAWLDGQLLTFTTDISISGLVFYLGWIPLTVYCLTWWRLLDALQRRGITEPA